MICDDDSCKLEPTRESVLDSPKHEQEEKKVEYNSMDSKSDDDIYTYPYVNDDWTEPKTIEEYSESILNSSLSAERRLSYINELIKLDNVKCFSTVSLILSRYIYAHIASIAKLIILLCSNKSNYPLIHKYIAVQYIKNFSDGDTYIDTLKEMTLSPEINSLSFHMRVKLLEGISVRSSEVDYVAKRLGSLIFGDTHMDHNTKFKVITRLVVPEVVSDILYESILRDDILGFSISYKILSAQRLLNDKITPEYVITAFKALTVIMRNPDVSYDQRADAADTVIHYASVDESYVLWKELGKTTIEELSAGNEVVKSLYTNRQNVHDETVMKSVNEMVVKVNTYTESKYSFNEVVDDIILRMDLYTRSIEKESLEETELKKEFDTIRQAEHFSGYNEDEDEDEDEYGFIDESGLNMGITAEEDVEESVEEKAITRTVINISSDITKGGIILALNRISDDIIKYNDYTACETLLVIYTIITSIDEQDPWFATLFQRLLEELNDMADTCSSGHMARLINILSGYKDFCIKISFKSQISAEIQAMIRSKIMEIGDEEIQGTLIEQMSGIDVERDELKTEKFRMFFATSVSGFMPNLKKEYVDAGFMNESELERLIVEAVMDFQGMGIRKEDFVIDKENLRYSKQYTSMDAPEDDTHHLTFSSLYNASVETIDFEFNKGIVSDEEEVIDIFGNDEEVKKELIDGEDFLVMDN